MGAVGTRNSGREKAGREKTERQFALVLLLTRSHRPVTKSEIRDAIEEYAADNDSAFERMFERDKDELRRIGIPVSGSRTASGADVYSIQRDELRLPALDLTADERSALVCAARAWGEASWGTVANRAIRKIESADCFTAPEPPAWRVEGTAGTHLIDQVLEAIRNRRAVSFEYRKPGGTAAERRRVEPWSLASVRGRWYLVGRDRDRGAARSFRLSRVVGRLKTTGSPDAFELPAAADATALIESIRAKPEPGDVISARVLVSKDTCWPIRDLGTVVESDESGDIVEVTEVSAERLLAEVLKAGSNAVPLDPADLRERARERLLWLQREVDARDASSGPLVDQVTRSGERSPSTHHRVSAAESLARLLAVIPWLQEHPGVTLDEAARKFDVTSGQLFAELELAVCTEIGRGEPLMDIDIWDSTLTVIDPLSIDQPLRLSSTEAASLLIGLRLLEPRVDGPAAGVVASVAEKLRRAAIEVGAELDRVEVIEPARPRNEIERSVVMGLDRGLALRISYWTESRDELTERTIEPRQVSWVDGIGYLSAHCRAAGGTRTFRLDRIRRCEVLSEPIRVAHRAGERVLDPAGPRAIFLLDREAGWLTEVVPNEGIAFGDDQVAMALPIASTQWAVRLVMAMAPRVRIAGPPELVEAVLEEIDSALGRYTRP